MQTHDDYFGMESEEHIQEDSGEIQLVSFFVGQEEFGADILIVEEIIRPMPISPTTPTTSGRRKRVRCCFDPRTR